MYIIVHYYHYHLTFILSMYIYVSAIRWFIQMYICIVAEFDGY